MNKSNTNTNTDSRYIENEPIRNEMCRKRTVYGKTKRKHRPYKKGRGSSEDIGKRISSDSEFAHLLSPLSYSKIIKGI